MFVDTQSHTHGQIQFSKKKCPVNYLYNLTNTDLGHYNVISITLYICTLIHWWLRSKVCKGHQHMLSLELYRWYNFNEEHLRVLHIIEYKADRLSNHIDGKPSTPPFIVSQSYRSRSCWLDSIQAIYRKSKIVSINRMTWTGQSCCMSCSQFCAHLVSR